MAIFLNTTKLNEWIPKLINETKKELVIIVPYIKTSDKMYVDDILEASKSIKSNLYFIRIFECTNYTKLILMTVNLKKV